MRFEYIVLLIIAFNVITAVMQQRAKKAREKALRESGGAAAGGSGSRGPVYEYEDRDEEELEGEFRDPYAGRDPVRSPASRRVGRDTVAGGGVPRDNGDEPMQMPGMGRDILDQLARDLGLKPHKPAPRPVEARQPSQTDVRAVRTMERERSLAVRSRETAGTLRKTSGPAIPEARQASSPARIARIEEGARSRTAPGTTPLRLDLRGPERLREAIVLKEILDAPVSRRRRTV